MKSDTSHGEQKYNCSPDGIYTGNDLSSRVSKTPPADATCAGDQVQPFLPVARAFSLLSTFRQKPLQHPANVSAHFSVNRSLRLAVFAVAHRPSLHLMASNMARQAEQFISKNQRVFS